MKNKKDEVVKAIKEALQKGEAMFYAFNRLSCETKVGFYGLDLAWYDAKEVLEAWLEKIEKEDEK